MRQMGVGRNRGAYQRLYRKLWSRRANAHGTCAFVCKCVTVRGFLNERQGVSLHVRGPPLRHPRLNTLRILASLGTPRPLRMVSMYMPGGSMLGLAGVLNLMTSPCGDRQGGWRGMHQKAGTHGSGSGSTGGAAATCEPMQPRSAERGGARVGRRRLFQGLKLPPHLLALQRQPDRPRVEGHRVGVRAGADEQGLGHRVGAAMLDRDLVPREDGARRPGDAGAGALRRRGAGRCLRATAG